MKMFINCTFLQLKKNTLNKRKHLQIYEKFYSFRFDTINKIQQSVNGKNSDINLKVGFVPKYVNLFEFATCSKMGLTFNKTLAFKFYFR